MSEGSDKILEILVLGHKLRLRATDEEHYVRDVIRYFESKFEETKLRSPNASELVLLILTGLNIVDELFREQKKVKNQNEELEKKAKDLDIQLNKIGL